MALIQGGDDGDGADAKICNSCASILSHLRMFGCTDPEPSTINVTVSPTASLDRHRYCLQRSGNLNGFHPLGRRCCARFLFDY